MARRSCVRLVRACVRASGGAKVYSVDRLDRPDVASRPAMAEVKCIVFVRPTRASVAALVQELREPKHRHYNLCANDP